MNEKNPIMIVGDSTTECSYTSYSTVSTTPLPLPTTMYVQRTESETQLVLDVIRAERRDERMFHRLIHGITERHQQMIAMNRGTRGAKPTPSIPINRSQNQYDEISEVDNSSILDCTIAKIVQAHHTTLRDSSDRLVHEVLRHDSDEYGESSSSHNDRNSGNHLRSFNRNLSSTDWSISGYEINEYCGIEDQQFDDEQDEDIFDLDL